MRKTRYLFICKKNLLTNLSLKKFYSNLNESSLKTFVEKIKIGKNSDYV